MKPVDVFLEIGKKRTFACAVDWPGWCRSGRDEESALQALIAYGSRYALALKLGGIAFQPPSEVSDLVVVERLEGTATTDFGAPDAVRNADSHPVNETELERLQAVMNACWKALDAAARSAEGKELRKGPRGGGRDLEGVLRHVLGSEAGYLSRLRWKLPKSDQRDLAEEIRLTRQGVLDALSSAVHDGLPERGPRGGVIWPVRLFVRREAWHVLDHAWEIEDRILPTP